MEDQTREHAPGLVAVGRDDFLAGAVEREYAYADVSDWYGPGRVIWLQSLTAAEKERFETAASTHKGGEHRAIIEHIRAKYLCLAIVDGPPPELWEQYGATSGTGRRLFQGNDADLKALSAKPARLLDQLRAVAHRLSAFSDGDLEDLKNGSARDLSDASSSSSRATLVRPTASS